MPKGMTQYWNRPFGVTNADTSLVLSVKGTCQYPFSNAHISGMADFVDTFIYLGNQIRICLGNRIDFQYRNSRCHLIWHQHTGKTPLAVTGFNYIYHSVAYTLPHSSCTSVSRD